MLDHSSTNRRMGALALAALIAAAFDARARAPDLATDAGFAEAAATNLVVNGDFAVDLSGWEFVDPVAFWHFIDAGDDVQSGSIAVNELAPTELVEISAARQCIALPAPGTYELSAKGNGGNLPPLAQDPLELRWAYRVAAGDCGGAPTLTGELFIPAGTGWRAPNAPTRLTVLPQEWSASTSFEIELVVERNANDPETSGIAGHFDDVSLRLLDDVVFATSYED